MLEYSPVSSVIADDKKETAFYSSTQTKTINTTKLCFEELSSVSKLRFDTESEKDIEGSSRSQTTSDEKLDPMFLKPPTEDSQNFYMKISLARIILQEAIDVLEKACELKTPENVLDREALYSKYAEKIFKLYPYSSIGENFRRVHVILMAVIQTNISEVLDAVQLSVLLKATKRFHTNINDYSQDDIKKQIQKFESYGLYITG